MNRFPVLGSLRIGCVGYLNARPLVHAYPGQMLYGHPSELALKMAGGELDLALIPIFEILRTPEYRVVDGVAIASKGEVYSVFLAYRGELNGIKSIQTDPASLTSVNLTQVLLREFHGLDPVLDTRAGVEGEGAGQLLIGNQAIEFRLRQQCHGAGFEYLDLGEEWLRRTGLPFVFAAWAIAPSVPLEVAREAAREIRLLKQQSRAELEQIIQGEADRQFAREYLTEKIRFDLGQPEKEAIALFGRLLCRHGLARARETVCFV